MTTTHQPDTTGEDPTTADSAAPVDRPGPDPVAARMKAHEEATRTRLPARTYTVIRLDGRAFHTYTRGLQQPFDATFAADMDATAAHLAADVAGCRIAYVQSDEISLVLTDFATTTTQPWFDGQVQKIVSVTAATAAAVLNRRRPDAALAVFDSRAFTLPSWDEVHDYLTWRQRDAHRNAVQMAAQAHFSARQLHGVSFPAMRELLRTDAGVDMTAYPAGFRHGRVVHKVTETDVVTYRRRDTGQVHTQQCERSRWTVAAAPWLASDDGTTWLRTHIPAHPDTATGT